MNPSGKKKQKQNISEIKNQKKIYQFFTLNDKDKQNKIQDEDIEKQEKLLKKIQKQKENGNLEEKNQDLQQQQKKIQTKKIVVKKERETNNQKLKQKINNKQKNRYRKSSLLSQLSQNDEQAFQSQQIEIEDLLLDQDEEMVYLAKQQAIMEDINVMKGGKQKQKNKKQQSKKGKKQKQINSEEQEIEQKNSDSEFEISLQKSNKKKGQKQQIQKQDKMQEEFKDQNVENVASNQNTLEDKDQENMYIKQLQAQEIQENQRVTRRQTRAQNGINQERQQIFEYQEIQQQIPYQPRKKYISQIEEQIQKMEEARGELFDKDVKDKLRKDLQKQQEDELNKKLEKVEKQLQQLFDDIKMTKLQCLLKANEECKFSYVNPDRQYSLVRASYWESYQHLGEGSKVYQNRKGKNYHNWLCFKCYDAFEEAEEIIRQFLLAFADYKAKLVIHQVLEMNKKSGKVVLNQKQQQQMNLFRKEILNEIFEFLA
ncbi:hypothetical protein PPERSA_00010 [Pseudocohnilembus persalinus]|uniref:Uncharacterized protein n=1 Tax=Pseudocohnilembus persalinus TaxID=266149 RepID=A0A0V0QV13_PSEPJ|nr:hypothetical protein PPERSA_00010 [Pseudocohnilembus persalinus]|eukprot:KRX06130.1 hypothetical protein PPERSA_00010 [Pseudocohnilembus persalinus]